MRLFGWSGKFYFPEIEIRWPQKKAFDHGNAFTLLFFLQSISRKWERERERARARAQEEKIQSEIACSSSSPRSRRRDRDLREIASSIAISRRLRSRRRSWSREEGEISIAPSIAISPRDRAVDRAVVGLETFSSLMIFFFSGLWLVFSDLCFPSSFPNTRKYFSENFLKCNQTQRNIFLFRKTFYGNQTQPKSHISPKNNRKTIQTLK